MLLQLFSFNCFSIFPQTSFIFWAQPYMHQFVHHSSSLPVSASCVFSQCCFITLCTSAWCDFNANREQNVNGSDSLPKKKSVRWMQRVKHKWFPLFWNSKWRGKPSIRLPTAVCVWMDVSSPAEATAANHCQSRDKLRPQSLWNTFASPDILIYLHTHTLEWLIFFLPEYPAGKWRLYGRDSVL